MTATFISYSRRDQVFAQRLVDSLNLSGRDSWIDWSGIDGAEDWWREICKGINEAENFLLIISPDSLTSEICHNEIAYARERNKRIIPIVRRYPDEKWLVGELFGKSWDQTARDNWQEVKRFNFIFFRKKPGFECQYDEVTKKVLNPECDGVDSDADDFDSAFKDLIEALERDADHVVPHTRLGNRAREWETKEHNKSFLLQGDDLKEAEIWLSASAGKNPPVNDLHISYITESRHVEDERLTQTQRLETRTRQFRRAAILLAVIGVLAVIMAALAGSSAFAATQSQQTAVAGAAIANMQVADAGRILTAVPPTLTEVNQQIENAREQLTQIPPTFTAIAQEISRGEARIDSLALADRASTLLNTDPEQAAVFAIHALRKIYTPQADKALIKAVSQLRTINAFSVAPDSIAGYAISSDGIIATYIQTSSLEGSRFKFFNTNDFSEIAQIPVDYYTSKNVTMLFSSDNRRLYAIGDGRFFIIDVEKKVVKADIKLEYSAPPPLITISPDRQFLFTKNSFSQPEIRDAFTGEVLAQLTRTGFFAEATNGITHAVFTEYYLVTAQNGNISFWDTTTWTEVKTIATGLVKINLLLSTPSKNGVIAINEKNILFIDEASQNISKEYNFPDLDNFLYDYGAISRDAKYLALVSGAWINLVDLEQEQLIARYPSVSGYISTVVFSPDGNFLYTCDYDLIRQISVEPSYQPFAIKTQYSIDIANTGVISGPYYVNENGKTDIISALWDGLTGRVLHVLDPRVIDPLISSPLVNITAITPDGRWLATAGSVMWNDTISGNLSGEAHQDSSVYLWDIKNLTYQATLLEKNLQNTGEEMFEQLQFSDDGTYLFAVSHQYSTSEYYLRLWDLKDSHLVWEKAIQDSQQINRIDLSPDNHFVMLDIEDRVTVLKISDGSEVNNFSDKYVVGWGFTPDSKILISRSSSHNFEIREILTGDLDKNYNIGENFAYNVDPRNLRAFTVRHDNNENGLAQLVDLESGNIFRQTFDLNYSFSKHIIVFSLDGRFFVTTQTNRESLLWHTDISAFLDDACKLVFDDTGIVNLDNEPTCPQFGGWATVPTSMPVATATIPVWTPIASPTLSRTPAPIP
jgi:WD40 repeat protein